VSPLIGGAPVRGHADVCLSAIGVESTTQAVAGLYADFLDGWLIDDADAPAVGFAPRLEVLTRPLSGRRVRPPARGPDSTFVDARPRDHRRYRRRGRGSGSEATQGRVPMTAGTRP